ncbi:hypothetical protein ES703_31403 [subsurface metagenome]
MEEEKCYKDVKEPVKCPKGSPKNMKCYKEKKIEVPCTKKRCVGGVLKYDDPKTGRVAGDPCKDAE